MTTIPTTIPERIALPSPAGPGPGALALTDVLGILRRRLLSIIVLFVLFAALACGAFYVWWTYFPTYAALGLIECVTSIPRESLTVADPRLPDREHERFVLTQVQMVESPEVIDAVLASAIVKNTQWYQQVPPHKFHHDELIEDLKVAPVRGTNHLSISMATRHKDDARPIVRQVMERYLEAVEARSADRYRDDLQSASEELNGFRDLLGAKREQLKALGERLPGGLVSGQASTAAREGLLYGQQVAELRLQLATLQQLRAYYLQGGQLSAEDAAAVEADPVVQRLAANLLMLEQQEAAASERYGSRHDVMRQLDATIRSTKESLAQTRQQKINENRDAVAARVENAHETTQHALFTSLENLSRAEAAQKDEDRAMNGYLALSDEIEVMQEREIRLAEHVSDLQRLIKTRSGVTIRPAQFPIEPRIRNSPRLIMLPLMIVLALLVSAGLAVGLELLNTSVRTTQDIVRHLDVALLGMVPDLDDEEVDIQHVELAVKEAPQSMVAEAFRQIRTNLQFSAPAARQRTVAVTSPSPDDGKTTVACNLAAVLAQGGRRVLLIDANLRRPMIHRHIKIVPLTGLSNILVGQSSLEECAARGPLPNLDVLGSGPMPPNPAELLAGEAFAKLLTEAMGRYDQVIIDTPPVLLASDAAVVGCAVDGVVMVVRANANTRGAARRACSILSSVNAHLFGAVLNAAQVTRGGYFREQLRSYYDYQPQAPATPGPPKLPGEEPKG